MMDWERIALVVAGVLAGVTIFEGKGRNLLAWAVLIICIVLLWP